MAEVLAVVGIRSGSKGVPDKNVRRVNGHPLVAWILDQAQRATSITRLIVSTDSERYAQIARHYGAEVPFLRPEHLARDDTPDYQMLMHALEWLTAQEAYRPQVVLRLLATVPLQLAEDIDGVVGVLRDQPELSSAMVVAEARQHPAKALRIVTGDSVPRLVSYLSGETADVEPLTRQTYEPAYFRANVVATRTATLQRTRSLVGDAVGHYLIPQERGLDIDSEADLAVAEHLLRRCGRQIADRPAWPGPG